MYNSKIEQNRLDVQAAAIIEMIGGAPCLAPVQSMTKVSKALDVGCGTGIATIQIAGIFPSAKVYGLDISPVPEIVQKQAPANTAWVVGNILDYDHDKPGDDVVSREILTAGGFDYIFGRMLFLGINDWSKYFTTAYRSLKSGGIIEHQDLDWAYYRVNTNECLSDSWEWYKAVTSGVERSGLSKRAGSDAAPLMEKAGLEVISVQTFEFSFVPSSKVPDSQAMGRYVQAKLVPNLPELYRKLLGAQGILGEESEQLIKDGLRDIASEEGIHQKYTVTIARKP